MKEYKVIVNGFVVGEHLPLTDAEAQRAEANGIVVIPVTQ